MERGIAKGWGKNRQKEQGKGREGGRRRHPTLKETNQLTQCINTIFLFNQGTFPVDGWLRAGQGRGGQGEGRLRAGQGRARGR